MVAELGELAGGGSAAMMRKTVGGLRERASAATDWRTGEWRAG